ncbi:MAG: helix-turn-helix transcriptional regulator [Firmicutes bacterium]|nr:helix-turn-helix transcriptional regulator [Bacillota bacterium]
MEDFVRERITALRIQKGVSEMQMSYDLGHSRSYINNITVRKSLPSMGEFFAICDYFNITPVEFFESADNAPSINKNILTSLNKLNYEDSILVTKLIERLSQK